MPGASTRFSENAGAGAPIFGGLRLVRQLPDEEPEQPGHRRQRDDLAGELQRAHQEETM